MARTRTRRQLLLSIRNLHYLRKGVQLPVSAGETYSSDGLVSGDQARLSNGKPKGASEDTYLVPQTDPACMAEGPETIITSATLVF